MLQYIVKRIVAMVITLFIIISLSFFAIRLIPGDVAGENAAPEIKEAMEARYHLDKPLGEQYAIFIKNFLSFDFGESMTLYPRRPVFAIIRDKIPLTLMLNIFSLCLTIPVGLACGIAAALKKNTIVDHVISAMVVFNVSVPAFVFATLLQYVFAYKLEWFPFLLELDSSFSLSKFASMILPILALSFGGIATITRYARRAVRGTEFGIHVAFQSEGPLPCTVHLAARVAQLLYPVVQRHHPNVYEPAGRLDGCRKHLRYPWHRFADRFVNPNLRLLSDHCGSVFLFHHRIDFDVAG